MMLLKQTRQDPRKADGPAGTIATTGPPYTALNLISQERRYGDVTALLERFHLARILPYVPSLIMLLSAVWIA